MRTCGRTVELPGEDSTSNSEYFVFSSLRISRPPGRCFWSRSTLSEVLCLAPLRLLAPPFLGQQVDAMFDLTGEARSSDLSHLLGSSFRKGVKATSDDQKGPLSRIKGSKKCVAVGTVKVLCRIRGKVARGPISFRRFSFAGSVKRSTLPHTCKTAASEERRALATTWYNEMVRSFL